MNVIDESFFGKDFFEEEVRCGFTVSSEMKRVWAAEMKVLSYVIGICEKYGITYFVDGGTLLGAVRHNGFIPWDDDIDITMKRDDYMKLMSALKKENNPEYKVISCFFDVNCSKPFTSISNYSKVPLPKKVYDNFFQCPYVAGIDVFTLDYVPRDDSLGKTQEGLYTAVYDVARSFDEYKANGELEHYVCEIEHLCNVKLVRDETLRAQLWRLAENIASIFTDEESDELRTMSLYVSGFPNRIFDKEWYESTVEFDFEGMKVAVPVGYDRILTQMYGDYMEMKQCAGLHDYPFFKNQKEHLKKFGKNYID
jgi:lipopolysaccharide cholinephosphotransferase